VTAKSTENAESPPAAASDDESGSDVTAESGENLENPENPNDASA
jgi:hypothetical protein